MRPSHLLVPLAVVALLCSVAGYVLFALVAKALAGLKR